MNKEMSLDVALDIIGTLRICLLYTSAVLPAAQQYFVHHDKEFPRPVGIELAAEIHVGVECQVILKQGFQKVEECTFACVELLRHQQQDGQLLNGLQVEQLKIVHSQLVLLPEDMFHQ